MIRSSMLAIALALCLPAQTPGRAPVRYAAMESPPLIVADDTVPAGVSGLFPDILNEILARRTGLTWTSTVLPWKRAQQEVQNGTADVMVTIPTDERRAYALVSDLPVLQMYLHVYTYRNHPKLKEIRKIKTAADILRLGLIPVTNLGNNWHRENIDAFGVRTHYAPADENIAKILASKRADIMIDTPISMNPMIATLGLSSRIEMTQARFGPIAFHLLVSRRSPYAQSMGAFNQAIEKMIQDGTLDHLTDKYQRP